MAAPTLRAVGTGNSYVGANSTLAKPSGVVEGDFLLAVLSADGPNSPITWAGRIPAGWAIAEEDLATGGTFKTHGAVAYKVAGASEPSSYAFSFGDQAGAGIIIAYQGVNPTTPINASAKQENASSTTSHSIPSVTTTVSDCLAVAVYQHRSNNGVPYTEPSGWTERVDYKGSNCNSNFGVADKVFASAGASGTVSATGSLADESWTVMIALAAAGGGAVTHTTTGALSSSAATLSSTSARTTAIVTHTATGALSTSAATLSGTSSHSGTAVTHVATATLTAGSSVLSGTTSHASSGTFVSDIMINNTGTVQTSVSITWEWNKGVIGSAKTSTIYGTGTTSGTGTYTATGLPPGNGFLLATTADGSVYYQTGTVV